MLNLYKGVDDNLFGVHDKQIVFLKKNTGAVKYQKQIVFECDNMTNKCLLNSNEKNVDFIGIHPKIIVPDDFKYTDQSKVLVLEDHGQVGVFMISKRKIRILIDSSREFKILFGGDIRSINLSKLSEYKYWPIWKVSKPLFDSIIKTLHSSDKSVYKIIEDIRPFYNFVEKLDMTKIEDYSPEAEAKQRQERETKRREEQERETKRREEAKQRELAREQRIAQINVKKELQTLKTTNDINQYGEALENLWLKNDLATNVEVNKNLLKRHNWIIDNLSKHSKLMTVSSPILFEIFEDVVYVLRDIIQQSKDSGSEDAIKKAEQYLTDRKKLVTMIVNFIPSTTTLDRLKEIDILYKQKIAGNREFFHIHNFTGDPHHLIKDWIEYIKYLQAKQYRLDSELQKLKSTQDINQFYQLFQELKEKIEKYYGGLEKEIAELQIYQILEQRYVWLINNLKNHQKIKSAFFGNEELNDEIQLELELIRGIMLNDYYSDETKILFKSLLESLKKYNQYLLLVERNNSLPDLPSKEIKTLIEQVDKKIRFEVKLPDIIKKQYLRLMKKSALLDI